MKTNPEIDQDRVFDLFDHYKKTGDPLFHQQRTIYENISKQLFFNTVLEAGCGSGIGSVILARGNDNTLIATDKLPSNINFACKLFPHIVFGVWDINKPGVNKAGSVVCIETFEHVDNPQAAMKNLLDATIDELWISTPNGRGKPRPPSNRYHVCEYTTEEMMEFSSKILRGTGQFHILHWKDLSVLDIHTKVDPLVYRIKK